MNIKDIVGNKKDFAIQYEINNSYDGFLYGKFCYWINNIQLGDYEQGVTFNDLLLTFPNILLNNDVREDEENFNIKLEEFEKKIKCYVPEIYPFHIAPLIDIFYDVTIYLIENNNRARFIVKEYYNNKSYNIFEYYTEKKVFHNVFNEVYLKLNEYFDNFIMNS